LQPTALAYRKIRNIFVYEVFNTEWPSLIDCLVYSVVSSHVCVFSENDVAAIDVNMGCPKEFSIKVVQQ